MFLKRLIIIVSVALLVMILSFSARSFADTDDNLLEHGKILQLLKKPSQNLFSQASNAADLSWVQTYLNSYPIGYSLEEVMVFEEIAIFPGYNEDTGKPYYFIAFLESKEILGIEWDTTNNKFIMFDLLSDSSIEISPFSDAGVKLYAGSISNRTLLRDFNDGVFASWWDNLLDLEDSLVGDGLCIFNSLTSEIQSIGLPTSLGDLAGFYCSTIRTNNEVMEMYGLLKTIGSCATGGFFSCAVAGTEIGLFIAHENCRPSWMNNCFGSSNCESNISLNQTVSGSWSSSCQSTHRSGRYAKYFTFTLSSSTNVQIDLQSSVDTYLFLLSGSGTNGSVIEPDDDDGSGYNSRITRTLAAGTYTIEATTYSSGRTGSFTVSVSTM